MFACNTCEILGSRNSKWSLLYLVFDCMWSVRIVLTCVRLTAVLVFREERNHRIKSCRGINSSKDLPWGSTYIATEYEAHVLHLQSQLVYIFRTALCMFCVFPSMCSHALYTLFYFTIVYEHCLFYLYFLTRKSGLVCPCVRLCACLPSRPFQIKEEVTDFRGNFLRKVCT